MLTKSSMLGACGALTIAMAWQPAAAFQDAAAEQVEDVPVTVSAFTADDIEDLNVGRTVGLFRYVPNAVGSSGAGIGSANNLYIRGIGNTETIATFDAPVGTFIDGVSISRQSANAIGLFDVERVEILRGPQGTLFGRNTTGGGVNVILKEPGNDVGGFLEGTYGRYDRKQLRGSIDLPLVKDMFSLKLSGYVRETDGSARNVTTGERFNDEDASGLRLAARLQATDGLSWSFALAKMIDESDNILDFRCNPADASDCGGRFGTTGLRQTFEPTESQFEPLTIIGRKANFALGNKAATSLLTSNIEWAAGGFTLSAITGYVDLAQEYAIDFADGRGAPTLEAPVPPVRGFRMGGHTILNDGSHKLFSQEFRLAGTLFGGLIDYVAGVHVHDEDNTTDFADISTTYVAGAEHNLLTADRTVVNGTNAKSAYLQADVNLTDALTVTAGARYTDEKKTFGIHDHRAVCLDCLDSENLVAANGAVIPQAKRSKVWTPRFAVDYSASDDVLLFASASRGYRSGGWNARAATASELLPFGAETAWSYEAGIKSEWYDGRLRVNLTGFYLDASDAAAPSALVRTDGSVAIVAQNTADFGNKGVELEVTAVPIDGLSVYANVGFQNARYKIDRNAGALGEFGALSVAAQQAACIAQLAAGGIAGAAGADAANLCGAGIVTADGSIADPAYTPDLSLAAGVSYDLQLPTAGVVITPSVNVAYRSKSETGSAGLSFYTGSVTGTSGTVYPSNPTSGDFLTGSDTSSHVLVSAGIAMETDDGTWLVVVDCDNCLNETYAQSSLANYTYVNRPMTWTVRARRKF